ncbi:MAG: hypothetical protein C4K58_00860 [Flavobacteriaceae bacterium]|nr:MAG: hypothetical protein C4K58_00860 [Flavobacteriaceae bacterium]
MILKSYFFRLFLWTALLLALFVYVLPGRIHSSDVAQIKNQASKDETTPTPSHLSQGKLLKGFCKNCQDLSFTPEGLLGLDFKGNLIRYSFSLSKIDTLATLEQDNTGFDLSENKLYITNQNRGILDFSLEQLDYRVLVSGVNKKPLGHLGGLIKTQESLCFTESDHSRSHDFWVDSFVEKSSKGKVLSFNLQKESLDTLTTGLIFPRGLCQKANEKNKLLVCLPRENKIAQITLDGPEKGKIEDFAQTPESLPFTITYDAYREVYWAVSPYKPSRLLSLSDKFVWLKNLLGRFPASVLKKQLLPNNQILKISKEGKILEILTEKSARSISCIAVSNESLYLGFENPKGVLEIPLDK